MVACFGTRFGTTRCPGQHCAGASRAPDRRAGWPQHSGVPSPEAGPNPPCCHQASRCGPAPAPARVRTPRPALFVVGCCSPFVRSDHHYLLLATATAQPAGAFQPFRPCRERWAERNPLPGNNISVQAGGPQRCQGLLNPGQFGLDHQHGATVHSSSNAQSHSGSRT
jgi:hypothetical protein